MSRVVVFIIGSVGLALVARAASLYGSSDHLAFFLVVLIAIGLLLGLVELWVRLARAEALTREIDALPKAATRASVDAASPRLAPLLRARVAGTPAPAPMLPFTPYLLGLLVMIGLLGTFLGLFETLQGARNALTTSGDVDALRRSLAAPMMGLSRAFGTSAAGVAASAALGLAAVVVRRSEGGVMAALARYASGPLASLTAAGRTLVALESLTHQGDALPAAAATLLEVVKRLESLETNVREGQEKAAAAGVAALRDAASSIRADIAAGVAKAASSVSGEIEPRLDRMAERLTKAASDHLTDVTAREDARAARIEAAIGERTQAEAAHAQAMRDTANAVVKQGETLPAATAALENAVARLGDLERAVRDGQTASALEASTAIRSAAESVRTDIANGVARAADAVSGEIEPRLNAVVARFAELAGAHVTTWSAREESRAERMEAAIALRSAAEAEHAQAMRDTARAVVHQGEMLPMAAEALEKAVARIGDLEKVVREGQVAANEHAASALKGAADGIREDIAKGVARAADAVSHEIEPRLQSIVERVADTASGHFAEWASREAERAARLEAATALRTAAETEHALAMRETASAVIKQGEMLPIAAASLDGAVQRIGDLERAVREGQVASAEHAASALRSAAEGIRADIAKGVERAAEGVSLEIEPRLQAIVARVAETANTHLATWSDREAERAARVEAAMALRTAAEAEHAQAMRETAGAVIKQGESLPLAAAALDGAVARMIELEQALRDGQVKGAADAADVLRVAAEGIRADLAQGIDRAATAVAAEIDPRVDLLMERLAEATGALSEEARQGLAQAGAVVTDASDAVKAGGAELTSVAELFSGAVDRYRAANDAWMTTLGKMEAEIERHAADDAGSILGGYLDQTREVFHESLQFQRELFQELRTLKISVASLASVAIPPDMPSEPRGRHDEADSE